MTTLADVADRLEVARMEAVANGDMSVSVVVRLLEAAGCEIQVRKTGHTRTLEDILNERRSGEATA